MTSQRPLQYPEDAAVVREWVAKVTRLAARFSARAGWVPFDPTNSLTGGTDLICVACTRTPEQAAPVSGSWDGEASDFVGMSVEVKVSRIDPVVAAVSG